MSEIRFYCQSCGKAIKVKEELAGRVGKCPGCAERVHVPAVAVAAMSIASVVESQSPPKTQNLISCPDCGKQISKSARACPNCGWSSNRRSRMVALAWAWTLGGAGAHKFYLGKVGEGVGYLFFCWTLIPALLALFEGFSYLSMSDREFAERFGTADADHGSSHVNPERIRLLAWCVGVVCLLAALSYLALPDMRKNAVLLAFAGILFMPPTWKWLPLAWNRLISNVRRHQIGKILLWCFGSILLLTASMTVVSTPEQWMDGLCLTGIGICILPAGWDFLIKRYKDQAKLIRIVRWSLGIVAFMLLPTASITTS